MKSLVAHPKDQVLIQNGLGLDGGELVVEGNARNRTGTEMRGGMILIKKDIGIQTGAPMMWLN